MTGLLCDLLIGLFLLVSHALFLAHVRGYALRVSEVTHCTVGLGARQRRGVKTPSGPPGRAPGRATPRLG